MSVFCSGVHHIDPFNPPPLELNPSPFSCPSSRIKPASKWVAAAAAVPVIFEEQPVELPISKGESEFHPQLNEQAKITSLLEFSGGKPLHEKFVDSFLPAAKSTWIEGGNPEGGIANEEIEIRIVCKPEISRPTTNELTNKEQNSAEFEKIAKTFAEKSRGKYLADGLHLKLEQATVLENDCMGAIQTSTYSDSTVPILGYKTIYNDNIDEESCTVKFVVRK